MPRTGNNIYKRKDGRYEGRILLGKTLYHKPQYIYVYAKTLKEVKQKMKDVAEGRGEKSTDCEISMQSAAGEWITEMKKRWKPTTYGMYQSVVNHYIMPILGNYRIEEINKNVLSDFVVELDKYSTKEELSDGYKKYICSIACQIMDYAGQTHQSRVIEPLMPEFRIQKKTARLPAEQDLIKLEKYLLDHLTDDTCLGILVAQNTGIRIGELCALQWKDIDLERGNIVIRRNLQRIRNDEEYEGQEKKEGKTKICVQMPKTTTSVRTIPLADGLLEILKTHQKDPDQYLISGKKKEWTEVRTLQYRFSAILRKCQIQPFHFHMLRHAFASKCVGQGCDIKSLSEILGHSSVQITMNIYVHSSTEQKKAVMNRVCRLQDPF